MKTNRQLMQLVSCFILCLSFLSLKAQNGLEGIIVEEYYVTDAADAAIVSGIQGPPEGSVVYRVYVDLAPGWRLQQIIGNIPNPIEVSTTTGFYNPPTGAATADAINAALFGLGATPLDSYVSFGVGGPNGFTGTFSGVLKVEDTDGSIYASDPRFQNTVEPINVVDGLLAINGTSAAFLDNAAPKDFVTVNGGGSYLAPNNGWFNLSGAQGPTAENKILIGQFTTDGEFSFKINVQAFDSNNPTVSELYTHTVPVDFNGAPSFIEPTLTFPQSDTAGCTQEGACNFNPGATVDDDSCIVPEENCTACNSSNDGLDLIDDDNDGVCNADEVLGCTELGACNFNDLATDDDGSCTDLPVPNCSECEGEALVIIDADGDGICDADEIGGCTNALACNFNDQATDDDGTCTDIPVENCSQCQGETLVLIDSDGDGICDADEIEGCTNALACNFNEQATDDDGSCTEIPVENCSECEGDVLIPIDSDSDGVCDADDECPQLANLVNDDDCITETGAPGVVINCSCETTIVEGCTNPNACNFNELANQDDDSCIVPVENCSECEGEQLVIVDSDGDGICDADEIAGCTSESACNFDPNATDAAPELCIEPIDNCTVCNDEGGVDLVDTDGDGICDAQEIPGCQSITACNFDPEATDDNGSCIEPSENCIECIAGGGFILVDSDGDGVCNANEIEGCQDSEACNFNPDATDPGDCIEPVEDCVACDGQGGIVIIDSDGDGVCDADEIDGCTSMTACNFSEDATEDDGSCIEPVENCQVCNSAGTGLDLVDSDDDGVCDADDECPFLSDLGNEDDCITEEGLPGVVANCECVTTVIPGCISETACNFDPFANQDNGSCVEPVENCLACNENNDGLVIIDADGDGICDADEISGCQDDLACNFDPEATDDDGSCVFNDDTCQLEDGSEGILVDCTCEQQLSPASATLLTLECGGQVIQITGAQAEDTNGGLATAETRTVYIFTPDGDATVPSYQGDNWPYVLAPGGVTIDDVGISANFSTNDDGVVLVNGQPVYQFANDATPEDANGAGLGGVWFYLTADGEPSEDACPDICPEDLSAGSMTAEMSSVELPVDGSVDASASYEGPEIPEEFTQLFVLTEGENLVIQALSADNTSPTSFTISDADYDAPTLVTIHSFVFDNDDTQAILDFVVLGQTQAGEVLGLIQEGIICAALDAAGAPIDVLPVADPCADLGGDADMDGICDDLDDCVGEVDAIGVCNGNCEADEDQDGICDDEDDCVGEVDAIGVCNGDCEADEDQDGICDDEDDCVGEVDAIGVCNGDCEADEDQDGVCDDIDDCVGDFDALGVCNGDCEADLNENGICDDQEEQPGVDCDNWVVYQADIRPGGITDIYEVTFDGIDANLDLIITSDVEVHIAYNPIDNLIYAVTASDGSYRTLNPHSESPMFSEYSLINANVGSIHQAAFDNEGLLVIGSSDDDEVYSVNLENNTVAIFDGFAPTSGGDIAFDEEGTAYLATRAGGGGLYILVNDVLSDDQLIGSVPALVTGMALASTNQLLVSHKDATTLMVRNLDGSAATPFNLKLNGEPFETFNGDMASGCNTFDDNIGNDCNYALYLTHDANGDNSEDGLYSVTLNGDGSTEINFLTSQGGRHIALSPNGSLIYMVGGSNIQTYEVATNTIINDVSVFNTSNNANLSGFPTAVTDSEGNVFIGGAGNNVWQVDPETGAATNIASGISVNGGDLIFAPTGEAGENELWIITRNNGSFTRVLDPENGSFSVDVPEILGAAVLENGNVLLANGDQDGEDGFIEVSLTEGVVATYDVDLPLYFGDLAGGCTNQDDLDICDEDNGTCYAFAATYDEGTTINGGSISPARADANMSLGMPERTDEMVFTTLGYSGSLTFQFGGIVPNEDGDDIEVVETSFNNPGCDAYPEFADVSVSLDGENFYYVGTVCKSDPFVDINDAVDSNGEPVEFSCVSYVRVANNDELTETPDGFDVDGVVALHNCESTSDDEDNDDSVPLEADSFMNILTSYPNPTAGVSQAVFVTSETNRTTLEVYDMNGRMVATLFNQIANADQEYRIEFDGSSLPNGIYIYRLTTVNETIISKFMIAK
jgi:predicted lipoprotein with Yx(FWY)xxD motif